MDRILLKDWSAWAPGVTSREEWNDWAVGNLEILPTTDKPKLEHLSPIARRRLSQLTRMVLHVGHELNEHNGSCRTVLYSRFGEISQQNGVTGKLIDSGEVRPAAFSLSVFNTPVSLLSIHEDNRQAAAVLLSGDRDLTSGLMSILSDVRLNPEKDFLIIFADELIPEDYQDLYDGELHPYAFAMVVGGRDSKRGISLDLDIGTSEDDDKPSEPLDFLRWILTAGNESFSVGGSGCRITIFRAGEK